VVRDFAEPLDQSTVPTFRDVPMTTFEVVNASVTMAEVLENDGASSRYCL